MSGRFKPTKRAPIVAALKAHGPMTKQEIADVLAWPLADVASAVDCARNLRPGEVFRVVDYRQPGGWARNVAVYAAEVGSDKPRPKYDKARAKAKNDAAYREKNRAAINAYHRARRVKESGKSAPFNPWLALAAPSSRSGIAAYTATIVSAP